MVSKDRLARRVYHFLLYFWRGPGPLGGRLRSLESDRPTPQRPQGQTG
jgi:hypothetical protein